MDIVKIISKGWKDRCDVSGTLLHLSKAFDFVGKSILLMRLKHDGTRGKTVRLLKYFLTDHKQTVLYNGEWSSQLIANIGVPQGTILGPLFLIIYFNDLPACILLFFITVYVFM